MVDDATQELVARYFDSGRRSRFVDELLFAAKSAAAPTGGEHQPPEATAAALRLVPNVRGDLDRAEVTLIESIMDRGWTWEQLGAAYGERSKQAMQQHYRRKGGHRTWPGTERHRPGASSIEDSPHRLTSAELDPADVEAVRKAVADLMATTYDVAGEHVADGAWLGFDHNADLVEQISTVGLEVLPRLEVGCRTVAQAITGMVEAAWDRRDPGREARRRQSWTARLNDSLQGLAQWIDRLPHADKNGANVDQLRAAMDHTLVRLHQHRDTIDQSIEELRQRQAELTPPAPDATEVPRT